MRPPLAWVASGSRTFREKKASADPVTMHGELPRGTGLRADEYSHAHCAHACACVDLLLCLCRSISLRLFPDYACADLLLWMFYCLVKIVIVPLIRRYLSTYACRSWKVYLSHSLSISCIDVLLFIACVFVLCRCWFSLAKLNCIL